MPVAARIPDICFLPQLQRRPIARRMAAWRRMGHDGRYRAAPAEVGVALGALGPSGPGAAKFVPSARSSATSMASLRRPAILRRESALERPVFLPERLVFRRGVQNLSRGRLQARPANVGATPAPPPVAAGGRRAVPPFNGPQSATHGPRPPSPTVPRRPSHPSPPPRAQTPGWETRNAS